VYGIYLLFEWLGRHPYWVTLGVFVLIGTVAISWYFDQNKPR
jgi:hypothetical protein